MRVCREVREGFPENGALNLDIDGWGVVFQTERMAWETVSETQESVSNMAKKRKKELGQREMASGGHGGAQASKAGKAAGLTSCRQVYWTW